MTFLARTPHKHVQFLIGQRHSILKVKNKMKRTTKPKFYVKQLSLQSNDCILQLGIDSSIIVKKTVGVPGGPRVEESLMFKYSLRGLYNYMGHIENQEKFKTYGHLHYVVPTLMLCFSDLLKAVW